MKISKKPSTVVPSKNKPEGLTTIHEALEELGVVMYNTIKEPWFTLSDILTMYNGSTNNMGTYRDKIIKKDPSMIVSYEIIKKAGIKIYTSNNRLNSRCTVINTKAVLYLMSILKTEEANDAFFKLYDALDQARIQQINDFELQFSEMQEDRRRLATQLAEEQERSSILKRRNLMLDAVADEYDMELPCLYKMTITRNVISDDYDYEDEEQDSDDDNHDLLDINSLRDIIDELDISSTKDNIIDMISEYGIPDDLVMSGYTWNNELNKYEPVNTKYIFDSAYDHLYQNNLEMYIDKFTIYHISDENISGSAWENLGEVSPAYKQDKSLLRLNSKLGEIFLRDKEGILESYLM